VTEAFDKLKARYDELKDSVSESEGRAQRLATQNDDLKTGMLDLTNWSNELKANTEKKLAASFESASRFRTMFLDKEAREAKVAEELKVAQLELGSREEALTTALARVSRLEAEHGKADDGRRSSERALAQARQRIAAAEHEQSDTQAQLSALKKELEVAEELAAKCSAARAAARAAEERLDAFGKENKDLKARAYDDLTKVKALEAKLGAKASELDEMALMCEELMAREEARSERAAS
jgi:chromosome segregation ATPase